MEDYIPYEEFERLQEKKEPAKQSVKVDWFGVIGKFFHAIWIILKFIGFGLSKLLKGIYNVLIKLNESMEKVRQSEWGKNLKKQYESQQHPTLNLQPPQKQSQAFDFGIRGLQQDFKKKKGKGKSWGI